MGLGCLLLSQVSVDGTYWGDMFLGLLVFGPGIVIAHLAGTVATLARVDEADSGLTSGLSNASFQVGAALGVAILTSVAVSRSDGPDPLVALTERFRSAFAAAIAFAALGIVTAAVLLGKGRQSRPPATQPVAAQVG